MVRTIEFADGRKVTITQPIGKDGAAAAKEALDRATERERAQREPGQRQYAAESDDNRDVDTRARVFDSDRGRVSDDNRGSRERAWYEPDPEPAMAQADDGDLAASSRPKRRRSR